MFRECPLVLGTSGGERLLAERERDFHHVVEQRQHAYFSVDDRKNNVPPPFAVRVGIGVVFQAADRKLDRLTGDMGLGLWSSCCVTVQTSASHMHTTVLCVCNGSVVVGEIPRNIVY